MTAAGTTLARGDCPVCGRDVALNLDGTMRGHRPPKKWRLTADRRWALCEGSREMPKAAKP